MDSKAVEDVLSGVAGVAGVRDLLYGRWARTALRRQLAQLLAPTAGLGRVHLERAKYKPGRKLTGYYHVEVVTAGRVMSRPIEVVWVPPGTAAAGPGPEEAAMEDAARSSGVMWPFRSLGASGSSISGQIRVFPLDAAFAHLVSLSTPRRAHDLIAVARGDPPVAPAPSYTVTAVRYRPRQRHVLRYDPAEPARSVTVFAKLYRPGGARRAAEIAGALAECVAGHEPRISAARALTGTEAADVLLFPCVPGAPLSAHLWDRGGGPNRHLAGAGAVLRSIHDGPASPPPDLARRTIDDEISAVARAAEHLGPLLPSAAARVQQLLPRVALVAEAIPAEPAGFAHGDFKTDHVWAAGERLTLLDFDTCCLAEPASDIGKFLADLAFWHGLTERPGLAGAQESFLLGYGDVSGDRLARARLYEALILTKLVVRRLRRFDRHWEARTERLTRSAEVLLSGGVLAAV